MALTDSVLICANDYCQDQGVGFFAQGDSGTTDLPLSNLLSPNLYEPMLFTSNSSATSWFTVDLQKTQLINMVSLLKHNLTYVAQWRVRIYDADPSVNSPVYDSGTVNCFPVVTGFGGLPWGEFNWGGSQQDYAIFNPVGFNRHTFLPIDTVAGRYIRIDISDTSNPVALQISRLWISKGYQPSFNIVYGSSLDPIDDTEVKRSRSGSRKYGRVTKRKQLTMNFELLPRKELLFNIFGPIHLRTGIAGEILVLLRPFDPEAWFYESVFGNLTDLERSTFSFHERMDTTLTVEEAP